MDLIAQDVNRAVIYSLDLDLQNIALWLLDNAKLFQDIEVNQLIDENVFSSFVNCLYQFQRFDIAAIGLFKDYILPRFASQWKNLFQQSRTPERDEKRLNGIYNFFSTEEDLLLNG